MKSVRLSVFRILAIAFVLLLSLQSLYSNGISEIAEPVPGVSFGAGRRESLVMSSLSTSEAPGTRWAASTAI